MLVVATAKTDIAVDESIFLTIGANITARVSHSNQGVSVADQTLIVLFVNLNLLAHD